MSRNERLNSLKNGRDKALSYLAEDPVECESDPVYLEMQQKVRQMKVVNDCAERGIALITTYNSCIKMRIKNSIFFVW